MILRPCYLLPTNVYLPSKYMTFSNFTDSQYHVFLDRSLFEALLDQSKDLPTFRIALLSSKQAESETVYDRLCNSPQFPDLSPEALPRFNQSIFLHPENSFKIGEFIRCHPPSYLRGLSRVLNNPFHDRYYGDPISELGTVFPECVVGETQMWPDATVETRLRVSTVEPEEAIDLVRKGQPRFIKSIAEYQWNDAAVLSLEIVRVGLQRAVDRETPLCIAADIMNEFVSLIRNPL